ncbi:unnamed protein product [Litomosoides sigmodontis]|uniref:Uncharacterized protein n=1 Tax=Litomosoides sigmodontis TaxID=42156 RepID=A0A3P6SY68_LITSI|nr:unnamed protein product [Litomosoides sigmodontis]
MMTVLGYFDVYLSQEIMHNMDNGADKISINWTKRYLLKSLQYLGPISMSIGSFILIVACVISLESRDKNTQILHNVEEVDPCKKMTLFQKGMVRKRMPMTDKEIREWTPVYKAVPLSKCESSPVMNKRRKCHSTPCIPQMLFDTVDNRKLYGRYFDSTFDADRGLVPDTYGCAPTSTSHTSHWEDVTVELHNPPSMPVSSAMRSLLSEISPVNSTQQSQSGHTSSFTRTGDFTCDEHNSSNIVVNIEPTAAGASTADTTEIRPLTEHNCPIVKDSRGGEGLEKDAPLASLDIELGISSSSSSSNTKVPNVDSFFTQ